MRDRTLQVKFLFKCSSLLRPLLGLFFMCSLLMSGCHGAKVRAKSPPDSSQPAQPVFLYEGERLAPSDCEITAGDSDLLALYVAHIQGGEFNVREHCVTALHPEVSSLSDMACEGSSCGIYDTYRRGPLDFALYFAAMNEALQHSEIHIERSDGSVDEGGAEERSGIFRLTSHTQVGRQTARFKLAPDVDCIVVLKTYRDLLTQDRVKLVFMTSLKDLSAPLSFGDFWAEHRRRGNGQHQVMVIERRFAEGRGRGELNERELLCVSSSGPLNPENGFYRFAVRERDRATSRVYATPRVAP
jgi:hypothetical protein